MELPEKETPEWKIFQEQFLKDVKFGKKLLVAIRGEVGYEFIINEIAEIRFVDNWLRIEGKRVVRNIKIQDIQELNIEF